LRNVWRVAIAIVANFILVPLLCWLLALMLPLSDGFRIGLMLLAAGAGSPFVPLLVSLSKGNQAWAAALMVLFTNLPATMIISETVLLSENTLLFFTTSAGSPSRTLTLFSPWPLFLIIYILAALLLYWACVRRVKRIAEK
jgi:predicted Na+-dependent transporter